MKKLLIILFIFFPTVCSAKPIQKGIIKIKDSNLVFLDNSDYVCGLVKKKWIPGILYSSNEFLSIIAERKNVITQIKKVSTNKKSLLIKKAEKLKKLNIKFTEKCKTKIEEFGTVIMQSVTPEPVLMVYTQTPITISSLPSVLPTPIVAELLTEVPQITIPPSGTPSVITNTMEPIPTISVIPKPDSFTNQGCKFDYSTLNYFIGSDIIAYDGQFLGKIYNSAFLADSIGNEFSKYGSIFSQTSIFNQFSKYGSKFQQYSALNEFALNPPIIFSNGVAKAFLTVNTTRCPRVDTFELALWANRIKDIAN